MKIANKFLRTAGIGNIRRNNSQDFGLWPSVFNLATKAVITVNATCGEGGREEYCKMAEGAKGRCGICDNFSPDTGKRHSIHFAIDGSNRWWQSPALFYGPEFEFVTITIDLKQVKYVPWLKQNPLDICLKYVLNMVNQFWTWKIFSIDFLQSVAAIL
ncbi:hypothetical protein WA026_017072 [Henosepilachna vigintioctopunctata]|uniref:Laminin N-terminal domain-containing protein n=1 Tax=Henosepilachna vigintioctopunctata TaxID=420089 RepID=A0AAW1TWT7_9CUCU